MRILRLLAKVVLLSILFAGSASAVIGQVAIAIILIIFLLFGEQLAHLILSGWMIGSTHHIKELFFGFFDQLHRLIPQNPPIASLEPLNFFQLISAHVFVLGMGVLGIYTILGSPSPEQRARMKAMVLKLILCLVLVAAAKPLLEALFGVSGGLTSWILSSWSGYVDEGIKYLKGLGELYSIFWNLTLIHKHGALEIWALLLTLLLAFSLFYLRLVMVGLLAVIFPLAIVLSFFYPLQQVGRKLIVLLILWTLAQVAWALALVTVGIAAPKLEGEVGRLGVKDFHICLGSFLFFIVAPLVLVGLIDWLFWLVLMFEVTQAAPLSIGAVVVDETLRP